MTRTNCSRATCPSSSKSQGNSRSEGSGRVNIELETGADQQRVYQDVQQEVARIRTFPEDTEKPVVSHFEIKRNALHHPASQVAVDLSADDVLNSPLLSWPVKRLDISPTSDAAVAIIMVNERIARTLKKAPVFIEGVGFRLETAYWCTRDLCYPDYVAMAARDAYKMADIVDPVRDIDFFEPYDPFDYKALHHLNALLLDKTGRTVRNLFESGNLNREGSHPMCPSGGALGVGNPIAATGLMKIAELYFQLSGQAGKRQIQRALRRGVAQAWGDLMQVGTVVILGTNP